MMIFPKTHIKICMDFYRNTVTYIKNRRKKMKKLILALLLAVMLSTISTINVGAAKYDTKTTEAIKGTPVVDGIIDGMWAKANEIEVKLVNQTIIPSNSTTTAKVRTMWDEKNLYILSQVYDTAVANKDIAEPDGIEFAIDEANDKTGVGNVVSGNPAAGVFQIFIFNSRKTGFGDKYTASADRFQGIVVPTDYGYITEVAIPWSTITPAEGTTVGLEVQINDNISGEKREGLVTWNSEACLGWSDTESHGNLILIAAPAEEEILQTTETAINPTSPQTSDTVMLFTLISLLSLGIVMKSIQICKSK